VTLHNLRKLRDSSINPVVKRVINPEPQKIFSSLTQTGFPVGTKLRNYYKEVWTVKENLSAQYYLESLSGGHMYLMKATSSEYKEIK